LTEEDHLKLPRVAIFGSSSFTEEAIDSC
jgi:hypothetical protein